MTCEPALRLPAEWEATDAVIIAWPHTGTDWQPILAEVQKCYVDLAHAILRHADLIVVAPNCRDAQNALGGAYARKATFIEIPTNDTWTRDYGPISLLGNKSRIFNDFCFNGWGLKFAADHDNLVTSELFAMGHLNGEYRNRLNFVLEGGSIESDGNGTILTTSRCLLSPNRNGGYTRIEIEQLLKEYLHVRRVLWLDHGSIAGDDTDGHIDTLARFAPNETIIYVGCDDPDDADYNELQLMRQELMQFTTADGMPYNLVELPKPDPIVDDDGQLLPATYANFLVLNDAVLMPTYRQPRKDILAAQIMHIAYPDRLVVPVDCTALIKQHGSLHCATMQIPKINA